MKVLRILASLLLASALVIPAAAVNYVPSAEVIRPNVTVDPDTDAEDDDYYASIHEEDGTEVEKIYVNGIEELVIHFLQPDIDEEEERYHIVFADGSTEKTADPDEKVHQELIDTEEELLNNDIRDLVPNFEEEWTKRTDGAPVENAELVKLFEVSIDDTTAEKMTEGRTLRFSFKVNGLKFGDKFVIINKVGDTWKFVDYTIAEDGTITLDVSELGVFAILKDSGADPVVDDETPKSPQTGVEAYTMELIAAAVVLCGAAVVLTKKSKRNVA
ncbi:MAG: hypothetical protein E7638_01800 [Ruminococcaceae bacterium]|nr:hypothetical protein [Oscillospiraceae bacterium]